MCKNIITKKVAGKCRHSIEELPIFVQCDEAKARGSDCNSDNVKDEYLGQTVTKEYCPDCEAAQEAEGAENH
jgi:hypothetical protein